LKILRVHNFYREAGGEDAVELAERELLAGAGHEVVVYERHSAEIADYGPWRRATLPARCAFAWDARRDLRALLSRERPAVAHFTNTFPLISPASYAVCREASVPVVQSLHNYRLLCPAADFFRAGAPCEECVEHSLLRSVRYACYRGSRSATAALAGALALHRARGTFAREVDLYLAPSEFARRKLVAGGLPAERVRVKPNFVAPDPGPREAPGDHALYVGRLAAEKGLGTLLTAWEGLPAEIPLRVAGDGPLRTRLEARAAGLGTRVRFLGQLPREALLRALRGARLLIFPSEAYETFGLAIAEAFACGVPVLAAGHGSAAELVEEGRTGLHFRPGDARDLAARIAWAWGHPEALLAMGRAARQEYESRYTPERNLALLLELYREAGARAD